MSSTLPAGLPVSPKSGEPIVVLTIAGSDSSGGAGIQADLRTFFAYGLLGTSAITAITAQNTVGVQAIAPVAPEIVAAQIESVLSDLPVSVIKIGMLANADIIRVVAQALARVPEIPVVLDPVMVSSTGAALLEDAAVTALITALLPLATVLTPNQREGARLVGPGSPEAMLTAIAAQTPATVVLTGGDVDTAEAIDLVQSPDGRVTTLRGPMHRTRATHGTGCTFASAIAAELALGHVTMAAIEAAKRYVSGAIQHATPVGAGKAPLDHLWRLRRP